MAIGLVIGLILERGILRLVYGRDEVVVVLVTYAVFLILEDVIVLIWGPQSYAAYQPMVAAGNIEIGELILSNYDIVLVGSLAAVARACAYWALKFTRYGRLLTTVIFDRETAAAFGINVTLVYTVTFIIGAMLGALGGAVMAPKISVTLGIGVEVIVLAFAVVAIGGMGSIEGALIGALIVGICRAAAVHLCRRSSCSSSTRVMALVLVVAALRTVRARAAEEDLTCRRARTSSARWCSWSPPRPAPLLPDWLVSLATIAFANALVVLGLVVLWRTGLVSFGQALYYCIGAYTVALIARWTGFTDAIVLVLLGGIAAGLVAAIGRLPARALSRNLLRDAVASRCR